MDGAYHGHTTACIDLSPYKFSGPGGSGTPDYVHVLPCPDVYRFPLSSKLYHGDWAYTTFVEGGICVKHTVV